MSHRVCHIVKTTLRTGEPKVVGDVTMTPFADFYWCGRINRYMREEPAAELTMADKRRMSRFQKKYEVDPWPTCPGCKSAQVRDADKGKCETQKA